ncbi:MAG: PD40 domain-containing protein [Candidatus Solibacter usitatus]|nr:PD40 domain-containing protein [Candidatus Solibacter usitatus]
MRNLTSTVVFSLAIASPVVGHAQEELYLHVTSPGLQRVVVAAPDFERRAGSDPPGSAEFASTLRKDLGEAVAITLLPDDRARLVEVDPTNQGLTRQRWRAVGAQFLLQGSLAGAGSQLVVEVRLFDLASGEVAYSKRLQSGAPLAPTMAHTLANDLVHLFTGRPGPFLSRIAFVSDRSGSKELWIMRWDGADPQQLTTHRSIALGPAWSPDGQWLAFTSFLRGNPQLLLLRPTEGYLKPVAALPGVNTSASFSPDGARIAFAAGADGNTDIYVVPVAGGTPERLTSSRAIDTQPAWAPNGRQIAFTSTAAGAPQVFLMDAEGSNIRRLTLGDTFADEAAWAPDGVRLAYTSFVADRFQIAILDLRTNTRSVVGAAGNNESPCWSPDGTMLAFVSDRSGRKQIYVTDPAGKPRQVTIDGNNLQPAWVAQLQ